MDAASNNSLLRPSFPYGVAGNIGKWCNYVCYNEWSKVSAGAGVQPIPSGGNRIERDAGYSGSASIERVTVNRSANRNRVAAKVST